MAKTGTDRKESRKKERKAGKASGQRSRLTPFLIYLCLGGLLFVSPPVAGLVFLGLIPTFVVLFVDTTPEKVARLNTMFSFNLSGVLPYMVDMWEKGGRMVHLMEVISDLVAWTVMLGAAGLGAATLWLFPVLAAGVQQILNRERASRLEKRRDELIDEWGVKVTGSP